MNKQKVWFWMKVMFALVLPGVLLLAACGSQARVGALQTESKSVELGDAKSARVEINMGAGNLVVTGGAEKLLEADFKYNVAALKPELSYTNGTLVLRQPEISGLPSLLDLTDFRNEWDLRLDDQVPMDLSLGLGGGTGNLQLSGLSLTALEINLGAGECTIDLGGSWPRDLAITITTGAANTTLRLPSQVGVRVNIEPGPNIIQATGLTQAEHVYTNAAYGVSDVTLQIDMQPGIGLITLEVEEAAATP